MLELSLALAACAVAQPTPLIYLDLAPDTARQVVVDREPGQYLGHVSTLLLPDGDILAVYPMGHGRGPIILKRSTDGGRTWSPRLPVPDSWATSAECPSIHLLTDAHGTQRLILWSGLFPARLSTSLDHGRTWSELTPAADGDPSDNAPWGGIVVMGSVEAAGDLGRYLAWFHDDGRFFRAGGQRSQTFNLYQVETSDGGVTWGQPRSIFAGDQIWLCEPGTIRSPDRRTIAMLLREESRRKRSHLMLSHDEGRSWSDPVELPLSLTGDRHTLRYAPDGRLLVTFRDHTVRGSITGDQEASTVPGASPTEGDWVLWVGTYDDLIAGRDGQYRVRLMDNHRAWDCAYPGLEVLPDATIVTTTYGHWTAGQPPYIVSIRFTMDELDAAAAAGARP